MADLTGLQLEDAVNRLALAIRTRNYEIGIAVLASLRVNLTQQELAGLVLISLERLIGSEPDVVNWAIASLIPDEIMHEIHCLISLPVYHSLVRQGLIPGRDLSVDARGRLLLKNYAAA
ncbi:MAG: hypothetical protein SFW36_23890 [Leptolyngbyaceae cyanobacterium bins.59]|nr:hypothetical protein [Leptolyngbyaceae cyanobacterium bins.59]